MSLATLPVGTAVYVVFGCGDDPSEPKYVFTDYAAANLQRRNSRCEKFTIYREPGNALTLLKPGVSETNHRVRNCALKPLPSDRELEAV